MTLGLLGLLGCGSPSSDSASIVPGKNAAFPEDANEKAGAAGISADKAAILFPEGTNEAESEELVYEGSMELQYAENFSVDYYEGGYRMLKTMDGTELFIVPEEKEIPENLPEEVIVMQQPIRNLYLVSSAVMDMFVKLHALDTIRFSGQKEENWYVEEARDAMERGDIRYAGKYSKPDYETIVSENCSLAIENRMITHTPEVIEMLNDFGIPVMIEYSSYESHPLGRVEWIKFFGAMVGKEEEAERIRRSSDYIPKMIELAGGRYIFEDMGEEGGRSTMNIQIEEFYEGAKDADFLIYNSTIDGGVDSIAQLLEKCPVLEDFKAVQEGNVFCTTNDYYQQSMSVGDLMKDFHIMLLRGDDMQMKYLFRLK